MSPPGRCETARTRPGSVRRRDGLAPASARAPNPMDRTRPVACVCAGWSILPRLNEASRLVAQRELLNLACRGHWQLLNYLEALGNFVDGDAAAVLQIIGELVQCWG